MDIVFILVEPAVPENVGASCRALKTMGLSELRLVNTVAHRHKQARILAHGSNDLLDAARYFDDLPAALSDIDLAIATSAKARHQWRSLTPADQLAELLTRKQGGLQKVALVFGCESSGLSNDQLALCDLVSSIELPAPYPSLNLSQAVMLYAYELRQLTGQPAPPVQPDLAQYGALRSKVKRLLEQQDYSPDSKLARWAMEILPKADNKAIGFLHALSDKLIKK